MTILHNTVNVIINKFIIFTVKTLNIAHWDYHCNHWILKRMTQMFQDWKRLLPAKIYWNGVKKSQKIISVSKSPIWRHLGETEWHFARLFITLDLIWCKYAYKIHLARIIIIKCFILHTIFLWDKISIYRQSWQYVSYFICVLH